MRFAGLARRRARPPTPGRLVDVDGISWHVEEAGAGTDLVLLHGYLGSTATWHRAMPALAERFHVVTADLPGAGYSSRPAGAPYDPRWLADGFDGLLRAMRCRRPVVGGHSLGAAVATWWASAHPDEPSGLVLVSPLAYRQEPPPGLRLAKRHPRLMGAFFSSPLGRLAIPRLVRRAAFAEAEMQARVNARRLLGHLDAAGGWAAATRMGLAAGEGAPGAEQFRAIRVPALVVWGDRDRVHRPAIGQRLLGDLGGPSRLVTLPASGHNCHEERPDLFAREVRDFFGS